MIRALKGMDTRTAQMVLASAGYYKGAIDGDLGPASMKAVVIIERNARALVNGWSDERRVIAAVQRVLNAQGYEPGLIDGYAGANTQEALTTWLGDRLGVDSSVERIAIPGAKTHDEQLLWPRQADVQRVFGRPGNADCTRGAVELPFHFPLAWNTDQSVRRFYCHKLVAESMQGIFETAAKHYGEKTYRDLRLDMWGGCYSYRRMRGGASWSMHSYGIAVDLDPERNMLRWDRTRAAFARPEYEPFWRIVMAHGATPAGYAWGKDWMHFQFARL